VTTLPEWTSATLTVLVEDAARTRKVIARHPLTVADETRVEIGAGTLAEGERVVLLLEAERDGGPPIILEQVLEAMRESDPPGPDGEPIEAADPPPMIEVQPFER
jgi:hypothetical protein